MKKISIIVLSIIFIFTLFPANTAEASQSFDIISVSDSQYTIRYSPAPKNYSQASPSATYVGQPLSNYTLLYALVYDVAGTQKYAPYSYKAEWENPDYIIVAGEQTVTMRLTSFNNFMKEPLTCQVYIYGIEKPVTPTPTPDVVTGPAIAAEANDIPEDTTTALTVSNLTLSPDTSYDINIDNADTASTYTWTSSDTSVASVNATTGKVKAKAKGKAVITCKGSDSSEYTADITVGTNDDMPTLTEDSLSLDTGDKFDIDVENKVKGGKIKFTSSDSKIVKVKSSSGVVTAVTSGDAEIYCTVKKDKTVYVLKCDVTVE